MRQYEQPKKKQVKDYQPKPEFMKVEENAEVEEEAPLELQSF